MDEITFKKLLNDQGRITELEIGGKLVLENAQQLKTEFTSILGLLGKRLKIKVLSVDEFDLSFIQLILSFIMHMDDNHVSYEFEWNIDVDQRTLLENVGLSNELFMNN